jgi:hypothetical protein
MNQERVIDICDRNPKSQPSLKNLVGGEERKHLLIANFCSCIRLLVRGGACLFLSNAVDSGIRVCASFPFGFFDNFQNLSPDLLLKIMSFGSLSLSVSLLYPFVFRFEEFRRRF